MKLGLSEAIAAAAFAVSIYAVVQTREANSPSIVVTPLLERSYLVCNQENLQFETRNIVRFNIVNNGGRTTSLQRIVAFPSIPPVVAESGDARALDPWFTLKRLEGFSELPEGSAAPREVLETKIKSAKSLLVAEDNYLKMAPPFLNIPLEPGKAATIDLVLSARHSESIGQVSGLTLTLLAEFSHAQQVPLKASFRPAQLGRGRCTANPK